MKLISDINNLVPLSQQHYMSAFSFALHLFYAVKSVLNTLSRGILFSLIIVFECMCP